MNIQILQEDLSKALITASRLTSSKIQLPVLANILLEADKNKLLVSATNLEVSITLKVGAKVEKEGKTTVPAKILNEIISNLKTGIIKLQSEKETLKVTAPNYESSISGMNASDFPTLPSSIGENSLNVPSKDLFESLEKILFAVSNDLSRPVLTGVLIIVKKDTLILVATDGFRLSQKKIKIQGPKDEIKFILPKNSLFELTRIGNEEAISFSFSKKNNQALFNLLNGIFSSRIIEGDFPDYEKIIPKDTKLKINVDKEDLLRTIKLASVFAKDAANVVKLKIGKDLIEVSAESQNTGTQKGRVEAKIEVLDKSSLTEESLTIAFNYRFLEEFLNAATSDEIQIEVSDANAPALFLDTEDKNFLHIIMPIRLQG